ncbi:MAG: sugar-binding protein [Ignavibacteriaceae bacterium]|jgi:hypothetical protein|nr:sugar-binding protein [Ignavibacteriaceae bacterium]
MRKLIYLLFCFSLAVNINAQKVIDAFDSTPTDTNYWNILNSHAGDIFNLTYVTSPKFSGTGAMKVDYKTSGYDSWGWFVGMEQWCPDSSDTYDLSGYDSLTFRYYVEKPVNEAINMVFRFCLLDVSNSPNGNKTYVQTDCEKYFSFHYILKTPTPGWNYVTMPLVNNDNVEGKGFAQRTWGGMQLGNQLLDLEKIKGFVWEFLVDGQDPKVAEGTIYFDAMELHGKQTKALTFFNGKAVPASIIFSQGRNGSCIVSDEETSNPATHKYSLKWTTPGQWDGPIFELVKKANLIEQWDQDTLKLKIKAPAGIGDLRLIFQDVDEDGAATADYPFEADYYLYADNMNYDNTWKTLEIPLSQFNLTAGVWDDLTSAHVDGTFDKTRVSQLKIFRTNDTRWQNQVVYLDEIWTGSPVFDVLAPIAPVQVTGAAGNYNNLVLWDDIPFEEGEVYNVFASLEPITDIHSRKVDQIGFNISENAQSMNHVLFSPARDQNVTYYYAVQCVDAAGNEGPFTTASEGVTNLAKGVPVINNGAPTNFAADGDLQEFSGIEPFEISLAKSTAHIPDGYGYTLDNDADFSFTAHLAMDDNYLYVGIDVNDNVLFSDETNNLDMSYLYDGIDLFLGLYDQRGPSHISYQKGTETDYHFRFNQWCAMLDMAGGGIILDATSPDFKFVEKFTGGYTIEAKISFAAIAEKIKAGHVFKPQLGMRIPIDFIGNDNDGTLPAKTRELVVTYSLKSNDQSYRDVSVWTNTWVGDKWTGIEDEYANEGMVTDYSLNQNYPNPFNPSTLISFNMKNQGNVSIKVFDILGREVTTLVNEFRNAGRFDVRFDASSLPSGIYFCRMVTNSFTKTIKMMMLK